ncbi:hypothetical protein H5410_045483 [Solanum commersonii]|uniref:Uncharacterized protein n=1 Tax=Solanum commersonii TaxID=4109 RepID=A0A9J5X9N2_SOLCO|nr:hypothetical protein H5410_045483 [Solanum commersonii]
MLDPMELYLRMFVLPRSNSMSSGHYSHMSSMHDVNSIHIYLQRRGSNLYPKQYITVVECLDLNNLGCGAGGTALPLIRGLEFEILLRVPPR